MEGDSSTSPDAGSSHEPDPQPHLAHELEPDSPTFRSHTSTVQIIATAIAVGAPQYNRGDSDACYHTYRLTAQMLLGSLRCPLHTEHAELLLSALTRASKMLSASRRAWVVREALDRIMLECVAAASGADGSAPKAARRAGGTVAVGANQSASTLLALPEELLTSCVLTLLSAADLGRWRRTSRSAGAAAASIAEARLRARASAAPTIIPLAPTPTTEAATGASSSSAAAPAPAPAVAAPAAALAAAPSLMGGVAPPPPAGVGPPAIRALGALEALEERVGGRPSHPWWVEWTPMRCEEMRLTEQPQYADQPELFNAGGPLSIRALLHK